MRAHSLLHTSRVGNARGFEALVPACAFGRRFLRGFVRWRRLGYAAINRSASAYGFVPSVLRGDELFVLLRFFQSHSQTFCAKAATFAQIRYTFQAGEVLHPRALERLDE